MYKNKLIIAAAGSGKTTFIINEALKIKKERVLITTYTIANEAEIRKKIIEINKCIPGNITIQTWFSFLLQHGVRPYQGGLIQKEISGMLLSNRQSGLKYTNSKGKPVYFSEEKDFANYYFTKSLKVYSDKLCKLVIRCNAKSNSEVINRLSRIYQHIYVDEIQDLAGYDLDFIKLLFQSNSRILLVGDPRQVTYLTHHEKKYTKYKNGLIKEFIINECKNVKCDIDDTSLNKSYRNNARIYEFSSKLYPEYAPCYSAQTNTTEHDGIFLVRKQDINKYLSTYEPMQLRNDKGNEDINLNYPVMNFGLAKGLSFDRVLIYPTKPIEKWLKDNDSSLEPTSRSKFYVALTRAKYSVGIVYDYDNNTSIKGTIKYT
ncbi:MAG: UvrD-helicase domain-containing protein [Ignavibacteriales bacterium]|nr:UvrD-helicase domain-containing protein [Ignavibacteriales bacterium]